jgi:hypothetical protein
VLLDYVEADAELVALLGGPHVYQTSDIREYREPSIGYTVLHFGEEEVFEPFVVQWDVFAPSGQETKIAARLRKLVTADTPRTIGGMRLRMLFEGGRPHAQPKIGVQHISFDVRYEPLRERYYQR